MYNQTKNNNPPLGFFNSSPQQQELYNFLFTNDQLSSIKSDPIRNRNLTKLLGLNGNKNKIRLFQNQTIPLVGLSILSLGLLIKKKYALSYLCALVLPAAFLVFLSAPAPYFMYYFSVYLIGYAFMFGVLSLVLSKLFKPRQFYCPIPQHAKKDS